MNGASNGAAHRPLATMNDEHVTAMARALLKVVYGLVWERASDAEKHAAKGKAVLLLEELAGVAPELGRKPSGRLLG